MAGTKKKKGTPPKKTFRGLLKGEFLVNSGSEQNWKFMLFLVGLAFMSISSSHWIDRKVVRISELQSNVEDLKSQYTDKHRDLMRLQLETEIINRTEVFGLKIPDRQPYYLVDKIYDEK